MNLDDAANVGEILGGLAILVTLIFGIRQIKEYNKAKGKGGRQRSRWSPSVSDLPIWTSGFNQQSRGRF